MLPDYIKQLFLMAYNGQANIMTPTIMQYGKRGLYVYELSRGTGIYHEPIFGVTVLTVHGEKTHALSKLLHSEKEAREYISTLSKEDY